MKSKHKEPGMSAFAAFLTLAAAVAAGCSGNGADGGVDADADADDRPDTLDVMDLGEDILEDLDAVSDYDAAADADDGADESAEWIDPPTTTITLSPTDDIILNPQRGFYRSVNLVEHPDFGWVREQGSTLAHSYVRLDDYREQDIDGSFLDAVNEGFGEARSAGIKIILRFAYNFGPYPDSEPDASKEWILHHLEQLEPVLADNADVIAVMQAGFIGAWGEWHTSTNNLLDDPEDKFDILEAILAALPAGRMVQLRYPPYKQEGYAGPLTEVEAYGGTSAARIGHHNDCFLASDTDYGTWPSDAIEEWKQYVALDTRFVAMGGETCNVNPPRSDCETALAEMERFHYSFINHEYHPGVVGGWETQGCRAEIEQRLGYRFTAAQVTYPPLAPPGGVLALAVRFTNQGWAAPFNQRPVYIVIDGPSRHVADLPGADPRWWMAGGEVEVAVRLQLPSGLETGIYSLALWLPDAAEPLRDDPRFAIRLANEGLWSAADGLNVLAAVEIDPSAPGSVRADADEFYVME
ncbi:MAG: DUF4832 domain-containing protein [Pseudomonadota bacterium]